MAVYPVVVFLKVLLYDYNLNRKWIILCCWPKICSSVLLQARCHCASGVGVCGRMWSGKYTLSLPTVYAAKLS